MSHFFILEDGPVASPGACGICGYSGNDRRYLDPRKDFEFYGSFIICEPCVGAMANDFDFLQPAQAHSLESRVEEAERELITLRAAVLNLESVHDLITQFNSGNSNSGLGGVAVRDPDPEPGIPDGSDGAEGTDDSESSSGDSEPDEDSGKSGPDDLSDLISANNRLLKL